MAVWNIKCLHMSWSFHGSEVQYNLLRVTAQEGIIGLFMCLKICIAHTVYVLMSNLSIFLMSDFNPRRPLVRLLSHPPMTWSLVTQKMVLMMMWQPLASKKLWFCSHGALPLPEMTPHKPMTCWLTSLEHKNLPVMIHYNLFQV